jgi:Mrp family chromosome partitioning ATPase
MTNSPASFQSLRVMLDALLPARAMLVVSAACDEDGHGTLASGLAEALADAGRKTVLISLHDRAAAEPSMCSAAVQYLSRAPKDLSEVLADLRSQHDVVMVIAPPVPKDPISLQVCRLADGVLLSVRMGRKITADDENTVTQLRRVGATLLGIVATQQEMRKLKARRDLAVGTAKPLEPAVQ